MNLNRIIQCDCEEGLKGLPDESVDCCVSSPPYWGLRDYGVMGQIGLEQTPEEYIARMVKVFSEVKRVLKNDGTLWLNIGDSYAGSGKGFNSDGSYGKCGKKQQSHKGTSTGNIPNSFNVPGLKPKDLVGIPWMLAFALRADGWYLRQDIIWNKPNPMPESVTDRCTKAHEYIFLLSKSNKYYYDAEAIKEPIKDSTVARMAQQIEEQKGSDRVPGKTNGNMKAVGPGRTPRPHIDRKGGNQASEKGIPAMAINGNGVKGHSGYFNAAGELIGNGMANKKSVWTVPTMPYSEAHFATFPQALIVPCIKAGSRRGGGNLRPIYGCRYYCGSCKEAGQKLSGLRAQSRLYQHSEYTTPKRVGAF